MIEGKHFLIDESIFDSMLLFKFAMIQERDFDYKVINNVPMDADTIRNFDYIIIHKASDRTKTKTPISTNSYYHIYE
jgi:hypothetical protein